MSYRSVDPGIDVSHAGAPYKGLFGVSGCAGCGMGVVPSWTGAPTEDPRGVREYSSVKIVYTVGGFGGAGAAAALNTQVREFFAGNTVRGPTSVSGGRQEFTVILGAQMRAGDIQQAAISAGAAAAPEMGAATIADTRVTIRSSDYVEAAAGPVPGEPGDVPRATAEISAPEEGFLSQKVAGVPVWGIGLGVVGLVGLVVVTVAVSGRKAPAAVAKNRRRRGRR